MVLTMFDSSTSLLEPPRFVSVRLQLDSVEPSHQPNSEKVTIQAVCNSYGCFTSSSYNSGGKSRTSVTAIPMTGNASKAGKVLRRRIGLQRKIINNGFTSIKWRDETHLDELITSSLINNNCAITHSTFRCTPKARRKSQSWRTWSRGGVQAHRVSTAV